MINLGQESLDVIEEDSEQNKSSFQTRDFRKVEGTLTH